MKIAAYIHICHSLKQYIGVVGIKLGGGPQCSVSVCQEHTVFFREAGERNSVTGLRFSHSLVFLRLDSIFAAKGFTAFGRHFPLCTCRV